MTERTKTGKTVVDCLECEDKIALPGQVKVGMVVTCPECGTKMEVVDLDPLEIDWAYDEPQYEEECEGW